MISITTDPIAVASALNYLQSDQAGAIDLFLGVVRNNTGDRPVDRLDYEAYDRMALSEMQKIADEAARRWPVLRCVIVHRKGELLVGETVPIWKKERFTNGEVWVNAHP